MNQMSFLPTDHQAEYHPKVRDLPVRERPVNRLREVGPTSVSTTELLACLLQTPDALQQAQELLARFEGLPGLVKRKMLVKNGDKRGTVYKLAA